MARRESKALAGFFPVPVHLIEVVADLLKPVVPEHKAGRAVVVDPCAGEGVALKVMSDRLEIRPGYKSVDTYACEMERTRWEVLRQTDPMRQRTWKQGQHVHGDFFHVRFSPGMADVLLLNPPYDQDREFKRLESRWIRHCAPILAQGGILVFIVPHYALAACADTMALHFTDLRAYRFPGKDFDTFKQVFVLGRKVERAAPEPGVAAWCHALADDATTADEVPMDGSGERYPLRYRITSNDWLGVSVNRTIWTMTHFDVSGVATMAPWASERGPMTDLDHPADLCHRLGAVYPVVNPPRPVHLAAALAAGVFNGLPASPNPGRSLPPLLVKGTFRRRWETVEQRHNKDGDLASEVQIEKPELEVWALDLRAAEYHQLRSSTETTGARDVASMTFADLLEAYSVDLLAALRAACPVLHDPGRDEEPPVEGLGRPLWPPQNSTVHALDKLTRQPGRGALVVGEVGTGKTSIALALAKVRGVARSLVICPPHLLTSWANQVRIVRPDADVVVLESISDVIRLRTHPGPVIAVLSREAAKLGHGWRDVGPVLGRTGQACPACGSKVEGDRLAEKRTRCQGHTLVTRTALGRWVLRHRHLLVRCDPGNVSLHKLIEPTAQGERFLAWAKKHPATDEHHQRLTVALSELYALLYRDEQGRNKILHAVAWARPSTAAHGLSVIPSYDRAQGKHQEYVEVRQRIAFACDVLPDLGAHPEESDGHPYGGSIPGRYGVKTSAECWRTFVQSWKYVNGTWEAKPDPRGWTPSHPDGFGRFGSGHDDTGPGYGRETLRNHKRGSSEALSYALTRIMLCAGVRLRGCGEPLFQAVPEPRRYPIGTYIARYGADVFDAVIVDECFPGDTLIATPSGDKKIRDIQPGDLVWSFAKDGRTVARRVVRHIELPSTKGIVRVHHNRGHFDCTPDHKIWRVDAGEYVRAASLCSGNELQFMERKHDADHYEAVSSVRIGFPVLGSTHSGREDLLKGVRRQDRGTGKIRHISREEAHQRGFGAEVDVIDLRGVRQGLLLEDREVCKTGSVLLSFVHVGGMEKEPAASGEAVCGSKSSGINSRVQGLGIQTHEPDQPGDGGAVRGGIFQAIVRKAVDILGTWGKRADHHAAARASRRVGLADGGCDSYQQSVMAGCFRGPCASNADDRGGVRRRLTPIHEAEEPRQEEDRHAGGDGLAGLPVLEQSHRKGLGWRGGRTQGGRIVRVLAVEPIDRPDVEFVYDLEIEETHNYFADGVLVSNCHEMASEGSAQGIVSTRLAQMANKTGALLLYMTGSLVNGYAESAFHALRAVSPKFRSEFGHKDRERFVDQYGLRKRVLVYDSKDKRAASRGAHSERVLSGTKKAGQAPGVLPVLLLDHLLGSAAIIHKADLEIGLPPQSEQTARFDLTPAQEERLNSLIETLKEAIKQTRFVAGCAGKLFGAFCHLMAYPDLAACGDYEVHWPDNVAVTRTRSFDVAPGALVARVSGLDPTVLLPKEAWMLATVQEELEQGRGCMVLPAQVELLDRLAWVLDQAGIEPVVLRSEKVQPSKREAWIDRHLNRKARRVLVTNPTCVQTGLNNLVSLATSIWYSNPDCKPIVYRQANGRIHRPGQTLPVRSMFPLYEHKLTQAGHKLLLHKVGVSLAVDGLDPDAVLEAAGVASEFTAGLNVGQQLYRMLVDEAGG